jgi:hypothetical protein
MAKTIQVEVDVAVKGDKSIKDLNQSVDDSGDKFLSLRRQIRETIVSLQEMSDKGQQGSAAFKELSGHLKELQVQQKQVAFASKQTVDQLASLPGTIGNIGQSFAAAKESVDTFGVGLVVALGVVALIVGAFVAMKKSLEATKEGQEKLEQVTIALEKIMNAFLAVIEPIAMQLVNLVTHLLKSKEVMDALKVTAQVLAGIFTFLAEATVALGKAIVNNIITGFKTLISVGGAAGKIIKGVFTLNWDEIKTGFNEGTEAIKKGFNDTIENGKALGTGLVNAYKDATDAATEAGKNFEKGAKRTTKTEEEENKKKLEETLKYLDAKQKLDAAALAKQKAIDDETNFSDEQKLYRQIKFDKDSYDLTIKGIEAKQALYTKDSNEWKGLQADKIKAEADFLAKSTDNATKLKDNQEKRAKEANDFEVKLRADLIKNDEENKAKRIKALDDEIQLLQIRQKGQLQGTKLYYDTLRNIEDLAHKKALENIKKGSKEEEIENARHAQANVDITKQEKAARLALELQYADQVGNLGANLTKLAGKNKDLAIAGIRIQEAASIGKIVMSDLSAIRTAYEASPLSFGLPWSAFYAVDLIAGVAAAHTSANDAISALNQVPGVESSGGSSAPAPSYGGVASVSAPIVNTQGGANPATQISQTIQNSNQQPIRAYVVSGDISTQQQLDRKINRGATFGLG